jgi:hypothetical protein
MENIHDMDMQNRRDNRKGEKNPESKLTEKDVLEIRSLYRTGNFTQQGLSAMFGMGHTRIGEIVNCQAWSHI